MVHGELGASKEGKGRGAGVAAEGAKGPDGGADAQVPGGCSAAQGHVGAPRTAAVTWGAGEAFCGRGHRAGLAPEAAFESRLGSCWEWDGL